MLQPLLSLPAQSAVRRPASSVAAATAAAARELGCETASVWLYTGEPAVLRCLDLYCRAIDLHTFGDRLPARQFERYAAALAGACEEATVEVTPIFVNGRRVGVLCLERADSAPAFTEDERLAAAVVAERVAGAVDGASRRTPIAEATPLCA